jgi:hypothetical protein
MYNITMHNENIQQHLAVAAEFLSILFIIAVTYSMLWVGYAFGF